MNHFQFSRGVHKGQVNKDNEFSVSQAFELTQRFSLADSSYDFHSRRKFPTRFSSDQYHNRDERLITCETNNARFTLLVMKQTSVFSQLVL